MSQKISDVITRTFMKFSTIKRRLETTAQWQWSATEVAGFSPSGLDLLSTSTIRLRKPKKLGVEPES